MYLLISSLNGKQKVFPYKRKRDAEEDMKYYYSKAVSTITVDDVKAKFEISENQARVTNDFDLIMSIHTIPDTIYRSLPDSIEYVVIEFANENETDTLRAYRFDSRQRATEFITANRNKYPKRRYCYVKKYRNYLMVEHDGHAPEIQQYNSYREAYNAMTCNYESHREWNKKNINKYDAYKTCTESGYNYNWLIVGGR